MATIPPALTAIRSDANRVAPSRNKASDGILPDAAHVAQGARSDHNPDSRGIYHAVDITNDPANGMDTWHWANVIAARMMAGLETRVEYLVSNDGEKDVIFHPAVSNIWRQNGSVKQEHRSHLHTSIKANVVAENNIKPYFVPVNQPEEDDMTQEEHDKLFELHAATFNASKPSILADINNMLKRGWNFNPADRNSAAFLKMTDTQEMIGAIRDGFAMMTDAPLASLRLGAEAIRKAANKILA
jgi:hypothetical protein